MSNVTIQKRGKYYQYKFEVAKVDGKRKFINKSGFDTKDEAIKAGNIAYTEYLNTGLVFKDEAPILNALLSGNLDFINFVSLPL